MDTPNNIRIANELLFEEVQAYLQQDKGVMIRVKGNSMKPFLREGDQVLLDPIGTARLSTGMIVLAKKEGSWLLHRVVRVNQQTVLLAGDGNLVLHEKVDYSNVFAIAKHLYRDDKAVDLNKKWRWILGLAWYRMRPIRRVMEKVFKS